MRNALRRLSIGAIAFIAIAGFGYDAQAICCKCTPQNMTDPPTECFTVPTLQNPLDCTSLPSEKQMTGYSCDKKPLTDAQCVKISSGGSGICTSDPKIAQATRQGTTTVSQPQASTVPSLLPQAVQLNTNIPGFTAPKDMGSLFATYVAAIFRYMISIAAFIATVMFIWGAFRYLVGSGVGGVTRGKAIMKDAVIGLLLVFSANLILRTINPELVSLPSLDITEIKTQLIGNYNASVLPSGAQLSAGGIKPSNAEEMILAGARLVSGVDPCVVLAVCQIESGLRWQWNGQMNGITKEAAYAYGPCQQAATLLHGGSVMGKAAKQVFSDFPLTSAMSSDKVTRAEKIAVGEWLINHYVGAGFVAAMNIKSNLGMFSQNEITAAAGYYAGAGSIQKWKDANGCTPRNGLKMKEGIPGNFESATCVSDFVGVQAGGKSDCPKDKYVCKGAPDSANMFSGTCSDGKPCYAAKTGFYTRSIVTAYLSMAKKYNCTISTGATPQTLAKAMELYQSQAAISTGGSSNNTVETIGGTTKGGHGMSLGSNIKVLLIGDSLAVGLNAPLGNLVRGTGAGFEAVAKVGKTMQEYVNGEMASGFKDALAKKPNYVFVSLGTNDEYLKNYSGTAKRSYDAIVKKITDIGADIYWIGPPSLPANYNNNNPSGEIIPIVNASTNYYDSRVLTLPRSDTLHPTGPGYKTWAQEVFKWATGR